MRFWTVLAAILVLCGLAQASAATFQGGTLATFAMPHPTPAASHITNGTWGSPTSTYKCGIPVLFSQQNELRMTGDAFSADAETLFPVAHMYYFNGSILTVDDTVDLPVSLALKFSSPFVGTRTFSFDLDFLFTPNTTGNPVKDADILTPQNVYASQTFAYDNVTYTLKLAGFSNDGGATIKDKFVLPENQSTHSDLYATLTQYLPPPQVPEPASMLIWSALAGTAMVIGYRWRKRA